MCIMMKMISLAFDHPSFEHLSKCNTSDSIICPTAIEFFSYILSIHNTIFGPWINYRNYIRHFNEDSPTRKIDFVAIVSPCTTTTTNISKTAGARLTFKRCRIVSVTIVFVSSVSCVGKWVDWNSTSTNIVTIRPSVNKLKNESRSRVKPVNKQKTKPVHHIHLMVTQESGNIETERIATSKTNTRWRPLEQQI